MKGAGVSEDANTRQDGDGVLILCGKCGDTVCGENGNALSFPAAIDAIEHACRFNDWHFDDQLGQWCCSTCSA